MGLQKKLFIYAGVGLLVLIILVGVFSLQTVNQGIRLVRQERLILVENIAADIDQVIQYLGEEIAEEASVLMWEREDNFADSLEEQLAPLRNHMQYDLASFYRVEQDVFLTMLDAEGKVIFAEPDSAQKASQSVNDISAIGQLIEDQQPFNGLEKGFLLQDATVLSFIAPVRDEQGEIKGILIAEMPDFPSIIGASFFRRQSGERYGLELVSGSGIILGSSKPGRVLSESPHWDVISPLSRERLSGVETHPASETGEAHLVAFAPLVYAPWGVVVVQPEDKALEMPWAMGQRLLIVSGLAVLLAIGLAWMVTRQVVFPLQRLAAIAQRFGTGDLDAAVSIKGKDEIGTLAQSFDTMRSRLKRSLGEIKQWNQDLEVRVKQRTKELEELSQRLNERDRERGDLLRKIIVAQEEERMRVARELHDEVGQTLTSLVMSLGSVEALCSRNSSARQRLESLRGLTSEAVEEIRRLIQNLRPSLLDGLGLVPAIHWFVENYLAPAGVKAELKAQGLDRRLPPTIEITLFRVVQEAITNIVRHANAKAARIQLKLNHSTITGSIEDDGKGFKVNTIRQDRRTGTGIGLLGMKERINLLKGKLNIKSQPGSGAKITFEIPLLEDGGEENSSSYS
jgi:signal transduction histidine kinase